MEGEGAIVDFLGGLSRVEYAVDAVVADGVHCGSLRTVFLSFACGGRGVVVHGFVVGRGYYCPAVKVAFVVHAPGGWGSANGSMAVVALESLGVRGREEFVVIADAVYGPVVIKSRKGEGMCVLVWVWRLHV